ncbi:MAG: DNA-3-methyladenine glycosylase [Bacillota bacterium]|nr:DNA-3-methyladenine glycosylase [Bacillota bacterium]
MEAAKRDERAGFGPLLERAFYDRPAVELAQALLGAELVHESPEGVASGLIVEVEAYAGPEDRAAHSRGGRRTGRTEVMFGPPGHAYVFAVYGMHWCFNVVAGPGGKPEAVLVRALEPLRGIELMRRRRSRPSRLHGGGDGSASNVVKTTLTFQDSPADAPLVESKRGGKGGDAGGGPAGRRERFLTAGPARLCQALAITGAEYGLPLWEPASPLRIHRGRAPVPAAQIASGPRVGVDYAGEWRDRPWRFWIRDNPYVSLPGRFPGDRPGRRSGER